MKNTLIIICLFGLLGSACAEKKEATSTENIMEPRAIEQLEKENTELDNLEKGIENDIKEIDAILNEVDKN